MANGFAHLHVHTEYSVLDGMARLNAAAQKVAADGQSALAITDHGSMGGVWKFASAARKAGVKPIIGVEAYLALAEDWRREPDRFTPAARLVERDDESSSDIDDDEKGKSGTTAQKKKNNEHITLLATNATGYTNLTALVNASADTFKNKPLMDYRLLKKHAEGVIAFTGCLGGPVLGPVSRGDMDQARHNLTRIVDTFGAGNVYVEVMEHGIPSETAALPRMAELAAEFGLPLVATNDAHHVYPEDTTTHEAWLAIQSEKTLSDPKRYKFNGTGYFLRTEEEMRALRPEAWWQEACDNTVVIADRCADVVPENPPMRLPKFEVPEGFADSGKYLFHLLTERSKPIYGEVMPQAVRDRLNMEWKVIRGKGFLDYFLIVDDVITWARSQGIRVGPGRGSAAGSIVSYILGIVQVDPLANNLLFERFLEPDRVGMPDIDVDFEKARRPEVLAYLAERWGRNRVARIGSFSASKTRRALRDAARVLELSDLGTRLSKLVPLGGGGQPYSLEKLADTTDMAGDAFRDAVEKSGDAGKRIVALARGFEDTVNGSSIHACGTLISDVDMTSLVPLRKDRTKAAASGLEMVTQWDGKDVDQYGLLKLDVLGLRNLDIVSRAAQYIFDITGETVDPDHLPHPNTKGDPRVDKAWELIQSGRTAGLFQMESDGMARLAQKIRPENLADLSAVVALYRPGPMSAGMDEMYARRKAGEEEVDYSIFTRDPAEQDAIASVLSETYGVFTYQEQLMRLSAVVSGFNAAMRSKLRKAVGKKNKQQMAEVGEALIAGAPQEFRDETTGEVTSPVFQTATAVKLFEYMKGSADYLFNASHSFAYAQLAYVTAYLKANWPAEYGAAILAMTDDAEKRGLALRALREEGITVLAPDINRSLAQTAPVDASTVLLGLSEIKEVSNAGYDLVRSREVDGKFRSVHDILCRTLTTVADDNNTLYQVASVSVVEALAESGALDSFGPRLGLLRTTRAAKTTDIPVPADEWGVLERSKRQRKRLGVIMGQHPMAALGRYVRAWSPGESGEPTTRLARGRSLVPLSQIPETEGSTFTVGVLAEWVEGAYSKGRRANFVLESSTQVIQGVVWDDALTIMRNSGTVPQVGSIVAVSARVNLRTQEITNDDDVVIETITTKQLTATRIWTVNVPELGVPSEPQVMPEALKHLLTAVPTPPEDPDPDPEDGPGEDAPVAPITPITSAPKAPEGPVQVPVVGMVNSLSYRWPRKNVWLINQQTGRTCTPPRAGSVPGTHVIMQGRTPVGLLVSLPPHLKGIPLPETIRLPDDPSWRIPWQDFIPAGAAENAAG